MQYDFNLPPGGALNLDVKGRFFKYRSGTGPIRVRASKGGYVDLLPGQGVWSLDYDSLNVQDRSGGNNAGVLIAGDFDFHDDRIVGTVEVVDGGRARTLAGLAYFAYGSMSTSTAGKRANVILWNPIGSGKSVTVKSAIVSSNTAQFIGVLQAPSQLGALQSNSKSKKVGGADGVLEVRGLEQAAFINSFNFTGANVGANGSFIIKLEEPIFLAPGTGVAVGASDTTVGSFITAGFEIIEESL